VAAEDRRTSGLPLAGVLHVPGDLVGRHHVVPHPHGDEDVRRHVLGVGRPGGDPGVGPGGGEPQGGVDRVVEGVDDVVGGSGVVRVGPEDPLSDRGRPHVGPEVPSLVGRAQDREGVEGGELVVVGVAILHALHVRPIGVVPGLLGGGGAVGAGTDAHPAGGRADAVQDVDRAEPVLLPLAGRPLEPALGRRRQPSQRLEGGRPVLLHPDGVVVRHRLTPVRQREARVGVPGPPEGRRGVVVLEGVEQEDALDEGVLGGRGPGVGEAHAAEHRRLGRLGRDARRVGRERGEDRKGEKGERSCAHGSISWSWMAAGGPRRAPRRPGTARPPWAGPPGSRPAARRRRSASGPGGGRSSPPGGRRRR